MSGQAPVAPADLLRQNGVQVTAQRLAVLRAVSDRPHGTADDVAEAVRDDIGAISRQAVYDALGVLVDKGLLRRMQLAGASTRYEQSNGDNHHHLVCRWCGTIEDVDCVAGVVPCLEPDSARGFDIDEAEVVFWGRCPACADPSGPAVARREDGRDDRRPARDHTEV